MTRKIVTLYDPNVGFKSKQKMIRDFVRDNPKSPSGRSIMHPREPLPQTGVPFYDNAKYTCEIP